MVYEPSVIAILKEQIQHFDVVKSGYELPGAWGFGAGCMMLEKGTLDKITFRCYEFKNGAVLQEDEVIDMDLFSCRARGRKGMFVSSKHNKDGLTGKAMEPRQIGWFRALTNSLLLRYLLVKASILFRKNIPARLRIWRNSKLLGRTS